MLWHKFFNFISMKNKFLTYLLLSLFCFTAHALAQDEEPSPAPEEDRGGFKKENLFTGGSIALSFFNNTFLVGANPVFGYSITRWADVGAVVNYSYSSARDYEIMDDKLRQSIYGGGFFTRLYPVRFLFAQGQVERNYIKLKYIYPDNRTETSNRSANSFLVGAGYTQGREAGSNSFFYLSVLFDLSGNENSPYTNVYGRPIPIIRAGVHVGLFQGRRGGY